MTSTPATNTYDIISDVKSQIWATELMSIHQYRRGILYYISTHCCLISDLIQWKSYAHFGINYVFLVSCLLCNSSPLQSFHGQMIPGRSRYFFMKNCLLISSRLLVPLVNWVTIMSRVCCNRTWRQLHTGHKHKHKLHVELIGETLRIFWLLLEAKCSLIVTLTCCTDCSILFHLKYAFPCSYSFDCMQDLMHVIETNYVSIIFSIISIRWSKLKGFTSLPSFFTHPVQYCTLGMIIIVYILLRYITLSL